MAGLFIVLLCGEKGEAYNISDKASDIMLKDLAAIIAKASGTKVVFDVPDAVEAAGYSTATKARLDNRKITELGFKARYDIETGIMARYDHINRETSAKRQILYAPSWRKYLTYSPKASNWQLQTDKLVKSDYFNGILAFLNNEKLSDYLEKNDLELHVKLHPIIAEQGSELVSVSCDRIKILNCDVKVKVEEYCAFITDFSSYVFDYACLNRPIM